MTIRIILSKFVEKRKIKVEVQTAHFRWRTWVTGMRNEPGNPVGTKVQLFLYDKLRREQARWTQSRDVVGYPSGRDGAIQACPLWNTRCIPQEKFPRKPYNKSFIDQVCSVKMAGYWPRTRFLFIYLFIFFFFCEFMDLDFVSVHIQAKTELGQYPAILTSHLVNNPYALKQMFPPKCKSFWKSYEVSYPTSASGVIVEWRGYSSFRIKVRSCNCTIFQFQPIFFWQFSCLYQLLRKRKQNNHLPKTGIPYPS